MTCRESRGHGDRLAAGVMLGALAVDPIRIQQYTLFGELNICHLYTNVMFFVSSLFKFLVENI